MFVANGLGPLGRADFGIEPTPGVQAARLAGQGQAPLAEALLEKSLVEARQIAHLANA